MAPIPLHAATASGWKPFGGTTPLRAKRVLKGKWAIDKREKTAGCLPLARSAAAQAAFPPAMRGHRRCAFQGEYPRRTSPVQSLTRTSPSAPDGAATSPQRGGRLGGADGVSGHAHARDSSLHFVPLRMTKYCTCGIRFFVILRRPLSPVILRSAATKDLALARFFLQRAAAAPLHIAIVAGRHPPPRLPFEGSWHGRRP